MMAESTGHSETPEAGVAEDVPVVQTMGVWDPMVRIFHWSLVGLFAFAFMTGDDWTSAHTQAGYAIGALIVFRVIWGLIGTRFARFSNFIYRPSTVAGFLGDTMMMRARRYVGHNPAGGMMVLALLIMVAIISVTGFMMTTDAYWGIEWVANLHKWSVDLTIGLIVLHIAGVIVSSIEHKENLVLSMITGRKRRS